MKDTEFRLLDPLTDFIDGKFDELHKTGELDGILAQLKEVVSQLPEDLSVSFDIQLNVFDNDREMGIALLRTGFNCHGGDDPYRHYGDSSVQKYSVNGEMCIVPDDYCPHCWEVWGFKFEQSTCPGCGYELGKEVKHLIDDDICPWCQEGKVTMSNPVCDSCGHEVDPRQVIWG